MKIIGVTGTNGKTTTTLMIHKMLTEAGYKTGFMSTVAWGGKRCKAANAPHDQRGCARDDSAALVHAAAGVEWLVLETTSHALAQHRTWGVPYSIAVLTNLTHEHLAYHGTFENIAMPSAKCSKWPTPTSRASA